MSPIPPTINVGALPAMKRFGSGNNGVQIHVTDNTHQFLTGLDTISRDPDAGHAAYHATVMVGAVNRLGSDFLPPNSYICGSNPRRRCVVYSGFEIEYELNRDLDSLFVEIVDIRVRSEEVKDQQRAGLWAVRFDEKQSEWGATQPKESLLTGSGRGSKENPVRVGINGYCRNLRHAANILPSHIAKGEESKLKKLQNEGYDLFYVPVDGNVAKAGWRSLMHMGQVWQSDNQVQAAQILASYMLEAHDKGLHIEWTSHRGGSFVLTEAMKLLAKNRGKDKKGINLEQRQKIFLSDNTTDKAHADQYRRALNMDVSDKTWTNAAPGIGQVVGSYLGADTMVISISDIFREESKGKRLDKALEAAELINKKVKEKQAIGAQVAGLVATLGISTALAWAILKAMSGTLVFSVPAINEKYYSGSSSLLKKLKDAASDASKKG